MSTKLVLVSGISGCVGSSIGLELLKKGYRVRGTVRAQSKGDAWAALYPEFKDQLEWAIVPDIATDGAFDDAVKGVDWIAHAASPFFFGITDNVKDVLDPAINGTVNMLKAAAKEKTVKRIVITSSVAAVEKFHDKPHKFTYDESNWFPIEYSDAATTKDELKLYVASKKLAEQAAWDFVAASKPGFTLTTILPSFVLGRVTQPVKQVKDLNTSAQWITGFLDGPSVPAAPIPSMVDVLDVALCHIAALEQDAAQGKRFITAGPILSSQKVWQALKDQIPEIEARLPPSPPEDPEPTWWLDTKAAEKDLNIKWTKLEDTVVASMRQALELGA